MEIDELTPAELRVWQAFPRGTEVNFRTTPDEEATAGNTWGPERTLRAEVLRTLLLNGPRTAGETAVLKVAGARITGRLDLQYAAVDCPVHLWACYFEEEVDLYGAQLRRLSLGISVLPSLHATALRLDDSLRLTLCRVRGPVRLAGARITGALFLDRARIGEPAQGADATSAPLPDDASVPPIPPVPDRRREDVLQLNGAVIEDHLSARGLTVHGTLRLHGASIAGALDLDEAQLDCPAGVALRGIGLAVGSDLNARYLTANGELCLKGATIAGTLGLSDSRLDNPTDTTLHASTLSVGADLHAMRLVSNGRINLRGARIPGQLNFAYATLSHPGGVALRASSLVAGELWFREARPIQGMVSLRRSQLDLLHIAPETWPDEVRLDGLTYTTLAPHELAERRLALLRQDRDGHVPFSYEQLTAAYRRIGDDGAARTVQLAKQRRHRATLPPYARLWGYVQDATVGYGFRPRPRGLLAVLTPADRHTRLHGRAPPRPETGRGPALQRALLHTRPSAADHRLRPGTCLYADQHGTPVAGLRPDHHGLGPRDDDRGGRHPHDQPPMTRNGRDLRRGQPIGLGPGLGSGAKFTRPRCGLAAGEQLSARKMWNYRSEQPTAGSALHAESDRGRCSENETNEVRQNPTD